MSKRTFTEEGLAAMSPAEFRSLVRRGEYTEPSEMACFGYWKANLCIVPKEYAYEFMLFSQRNPRPCHVTDATEPGDPCPRGLAPDGDVRTDLPRYRVFKDGELIDEPTDILKYWRDDLVAFFIGFGGNFIVAMLNANVRFKPVGAYTSNIPCIPAGRFRGHLVVGCHIFKTSYDAVRAVQISSRHPAGHGPPVHIGDPAAIGIKDLSQPDVFDLRGVKTMCHPEMFSHPGVPQPGEVLLYWAAGPTAGLMAQESKIPLVITHKPAHLFVSDRRVEEFSVF